MSTSTPTPAPTPVLVVDVLELAEHIDRYIRDPARNDRSYTDLFTGNKTDFAANPAGSVVASRVVLNSDVHAILGWAICETTGAAPASIRLIDGGAAGGEVFARVNLQANESVRDWYIPKGIRCFTGRLFLQVISGSVEGVVYWL